MEFIQKFGLWVAAAVIALAAIVVYFVRVPSLVRERNTKWTTLVQSRDALKKWAQNPANIPNEAKVTEALRVGKQVTLQLDDCGRYLGLQPRRCQTRSFFEDEHADRSVEIPLNRPSAWLEAYAKNNDELRKELADAGFRNSFMIQTLDGQWGTAAPTPEQITAAMQLFWFQKDLADFVTEQVEKDLAAYMALKATGRAEPFPATPSDLVINRRPGYLDELLRSKSRKQLVAILSGIVVNTQEQDLATIFNTYLPDEGAGEPNPENGFPWERKNGQEKPSVLGTIIDEAQKNFLTEMVPPDQEDLADRRRFLDYIMELRTVRYRQDVIGLLESQKNFENLAKSLRKGTEEEYANVLADFGKEDVWSATRLAQAISAVVSIKDAKDYLLVRNNHSQNILALEGVTLRSGQEAAGMSSAGDTGGGPGRGAGGGGRGRGRGPPAGFRQSVGIGRALAPGGAALPGESTLYKAYSFGMRVRVEFKRIPVFLRRLLTNSWRCRVTFSLVAPSAGPAGAAEGGRMGMGGFQTMPTRARSGGGATPAGLVPPPTSELDPEAVEPGHYVWVQLDGLAFQFKPLLPKATEKPAGTGAPAPSPTSFGPAPSPPSAAPARPSGRAAPAPPPGSAAPARPSGRAAPAPPPGSSPQ